jgi:hypothetical protein
MVSVTFVITDDAIPANELEGVVVRIFSEDGETFVTQGETDEDGELVLELEDATTYWVRFFKIGYQFKSKLTVDVDSGASSNTFDVEGTDLTILAPSTVPQLCRVGGYTRDAALAPKGGIRITFSLTGKPRVVAGQAIVVQDLIGVSDSDGWLEVELVRSGVYDVVVDGIDDSVYRVVVPDRTSCSLTELIWPYIAELVYSLDGEETTSVGLEVDEELAVVATVILSSGLETPYELDDSTEREAGNFVSLAVEDPDVVEAALDGNTLTLAGKAAGTTTITAEVIGGVETNRLPEPTRYLATLTVTVTG